MSGAGPSSRVLRGVAGTAALVSMITVVARLIGFGRVFVFSSAVGTGCTGAAYTAANQLPNVLFEVVAGGALAGVVVPVTVGLISHGRSDDADRAVSALLTWAVCVLTPVALLLALLAGPLTAVFLHEEAASVDGLARTMLLIFAPQVVLYGAGIVLAGALQAHGRFVWPALAPLLSSLAVIATYGAYARSAGAARGADCFEPGTGQVWILAGGTTLGVVALTLPLLWPVRRAGVRLRPTLRLPADVVPQARLLALAGLGTLVAQQIAVVATLVVAGRLGGADVLVAVQFAQAVYLLPYAVLAVPLATVVFPRLSGRAAVGDRPGFARTTSVSLRAVLTTGLLGAAGLIAVAPAVEGFFLAIDVVKSQAVGHLAAAVTGYAPGLVGFALFALLTRGLFATGHGRVAAWSVTVGWAASIVCVVAFILVARAASGGGGPDGEAGEADRAATAMAGLGWGNSAGMTLGAVLLVMALVRTAGAESAAGAGRSLALGLVAGAAAAGAGRVVVDALLTAGALGSLVAGLAGGLVVVLVFGLLGGFPQRDLLRELAALRTTGE